MAADKNKGKKKKRFVSNEGTNVEGCTLIDTVYALMASVSKLV